MTSQQKSSPNTSLRLQKTALAKIEVAYHERLAQLRYAAETQSKYLSCLVHFGRWMGKHSIPISKVDTSLVKHFVETHLPCCQCDGRVQRHPQQVRAALRQLLPLLSEAYQAVENPDAISIELDQYDAYLRDQRGLAVNTRSQRRRIVSDLLLHSLDCNGRLHTITKGMLRSVMSSRIKRWSPASCAVMNGALRSYLRYRTQQGDDVTSLIPTIVSPACWRLASLPDTLSNDEVELVLGSFKAPLPSRRRGSAIAQCVARLGLRASEVIGLELDDINWNAGTIVLRRCKSKRSDLLPLPVSVGAAIAEYLLNERPVCASRLVFVRHVAPVEKPLLPSTVGRIIREAYQRCALPYTRVHIFRHSLAARVLENGGTLKEVADILRHRSLDTAQIYAKLDEKRLEAVAMPWPGIIS